MVKWKIKNKDSMLYSPLHREYKSKFRHQISNPHW
jgi:hypothetical protein